MHGRARFFALTTLSLGLAACLGACEGTPDLQFSLEQPQDASPADGASPDGSTSSDSSVPPGSDAAPDAGGPGGGEDGGSVDAHPGHDADLVDAGSDDAAAPVDATPPADAGAGFDAGTCGLDPSAPPGSGCCGTVKCIGAACNHCGACSATCAEWCCATENGAGKWKSNQCVSTTDPAACPLTEH